MDTNNTLDFEYSFEFSSGKKIDFLIQLDSTTLKYIPPTKEFHSKWAELENNKCGNCPLKPDDSPFCPVALNLVYIIPSFVNYNSYDDVTVLVKTEERSYKTKTTVQQGLSSMLGIYMVSSGCPVMSRLRPMVRFHLPFASVEETIFRSASTYLLGEYFKHKRGEKVDWELNKLVDLYKEIQKVNLGMANRLRTLKTLDANVNALIVLDVFAKELPQNIEDDLEKLAYIYNPQP